MNAQELLDEVLEILRKVKDDKEKLEKIHEFVVNEIYEEPEEEKEEIPKKYKKTVKEVADWLLMGFVCYVNAKTLEVEQVPQHSDEIYFDGEDDEHGAKHLTWEKCVEFSPMDSGESFRVMERFVDRVSDAKLQDSLVYALNNRKPFANFKYKVENSDYREEWFDFRQEQWECYVWNKMKFELEQ